MEAVDVALCLTQCGMKRRNEEDNQDKGVRHGSKGILGLTWKVCQGSRIHTTPSSSMASPPNRYQDHETGSLVLAFPMALIHNKTMPPELTGEE